MPHGIIPALFMSWQRLQLSFWNTSQFRPGSTLKAAASAFEPPARFNFKPRI